MKEIAVIIIAVAILVGSLLGGATCACDGLSQLEPDAASIEDASEEEVDAGPDAGADAGDQDAGDADGGEVDAGELDAGPVDACNGRTCGDDGTGFGCGTCAPDRQCGVEGNCLCFATSCAARGATCGELSNGCGALEACGSCSGGETCGGGGVDGNCGRPTCVDGWCLVQPLPSDGTFHAIARAGERALLAGDDGVLLAFDGTTWRRSVIDEAVEGEGRVDLFAAVIDADGGGFVGGRGGWIWPVGASSVGTPFRLDDVGGGRASVRGLASSGAALLVAAAAAPGETESEPTNARYGLFRRESGTFTALRSGLPAYAITNLAPNLFAVATSQGVLEGDGVSFGLGAGSTGLVVTSVSAREGVANAAYAIAGGELFQRLGTTWTRTLASGSGGAPAPVSGVRALAVAAGDALVRSNDGSVLRVREGEPLTTAASLLVPSGVTAMASDARGPWLAAAGGRISRPTPTGLAGRIRDGFVPSLASISGTEAGNLWGVSEGVAWRFDGRSWARVDPPLSDMLRGGTFRVTSAVALGNALSCLGLRVLVPPALTDAEGVVACVVDGAWRVESVGAGESSVPVSVLLEGARDVTVSLAGGGMRVRSHVGWRSVPGPFSSGALGVRRAPDGSVWAFDATRLARRPSSTAAWAGVDGPQLASFGGLAFDEAGSPIVAGVRGGANPVPSLATVAEQLWTVSPLPVPADFRTTGGREARVKGFVHDGASFLVGGDFGVVRADLVVPTIVSPDSVSGLASTADGLFAAGAPGGRVEDGVLRKRGKIPLESTRCGAAIVGGVPVVAGGGVAAFGASGASSWGAAPAGTGGYSAIATWDGVTWLAGWSRVTDGGQERARLTVASSANGRTTVLSTEEVEPGPDLAGVDLAASATQLWLARGDGVSRFFDGAFAPDAAALPVTGPLDVRAVTVDAAGDVWIGGRARCVSSTCRPLAVRRAEAWTAVVIPGAEFTVADLSSDSNGLWIAGSTSSGAAVAYGSEGDFQVFPLGGAASARATSIAVDGSDADLTTSDGRIVRVRAVGGVPERVRETALGGALGCIAAGGGAGVAAGAGGRVFVREAP